MNKINKFNRSTMEYGFVLILTLMSAADKLFMHPTKSWWDVMGIVGCYYLVIFIGGVFEIFLDWVIEMLEKRKVK